MTVAPDQHSDVLIVGTGHAGAQLAASLRQGGFTGSIRLLGEEPDLPYERPPLSKEYLSGERPAERLLLRAAEFWPANRINLNLSRRVMSVDCARHAVICEDGSRWRYEKLVWAAGGAPRQLSMPGSSLQGLYTLRTRADADRLRIAMQQGSDFAIIGGGYIGLELAPALIGAGRQVEVIEAQDRLLARVAGPEIASYVRKVHEAHGVRVRLGAQVESLEGDGPRVSSVRLANGAGQIRCQAVVAAIGMAPSVSELAAAGAAVTHGIEVDEFCRTSLPDVFAVGDCTVHASPWADGQRVRIESVPNAVEQAKTAARALLGKPEPYRALPWFWSNQFDMKIQTVGLSIGHDDRVVRGAPESGSFSVIYLRRGRVVALDCVNCARDFIQGRTLIEHAVEAAKTRLADVSAPLRSMAP